MASEVKLPSAGKGEFPLLQEKLSEVQDALDTATLGLSGKEHEEAALAAHIQAATMLAEMRQRSEIFERRARESDPDRQIYGPKMIRKVLDFCDALQSAAEQCEELEEALQPIRAQHAAAAAVAAAQERAEAERVAAAAREAAAERVAAQARMEEVARHEEAERARQRAAAIAAPLFGTPSASDAGIEADELGRRPLVKGLNFGSALDLLEQQGCDDPEGLAAALQALQVLCTNVIARPEEVTFRTIRLLNASFQQDVARRPGGVEALLAMGFEEKESLEEDAIFYVLEEPSLENDYEGWAAWYDAVKSYRDELLTRMEARGVRAVPAASKGTGWNEATPPPPLNSPDVLTLHGQRGGGI
jgi:hypothetical protein